MQGSTRLRRRCMPDLGEALQTTGADCADSVLPARTRPLPDLAYDYRSGLGRPDRCPEAAAAEVLAASGKVRDTLR